MYILKHILIVLLAVLFSTGSGNNRDKYNKKFDSTNWQIDRG